MMFKINDYFDEIYCLNLERRFDRLQKMQLRFDHFDIKFTTICAVDALSMEDAEFKNFKQFKKISKKELCCALGHAAIYRDAALKNHKRILIFEDDVMFVENFNAKIEKINEINWNLVLLGSSNYSSTPTVTNGFYNPVKDWGTFAYAINNNCYEQLLQWIDSDGYDVADHITIRYFNERKNKCFVFFPNICIADVTDSDMRQSQNQLKINKLLKWNLIQEKII